MKYNLAHIEQAIENLRYETGRSSVEVDIEYKKESLDKGSLLECISVTACNEVSPRDWERLSSVKHQTITVEIYPAAEGRPPRVFVEEYRDLVNRTKG